MVEYRLSVQSGSYHQNMTFDTDVRSFPFCIQTFGYFIAKDTYYTKRSGRNDYLLIITTAGAGKMHWMGQSCLLEKGSAILIDCNLYQEYATLPEHTWSFYFIHFSAASMEGYGHFFLRGLTPVILNDLDKSVALMQQLKGYSFENRTLCAASQSNVISALLTEMALFLHSGTNDPSHQKRSEITDLAHFIRNNCARPLHLSDFVEFTHLSKHYLIRTFEKQLGMSPYKYLHLCRIEKSLSLLRNDDMSIAQIAYAVGYNDPIVFIRHFKFFHKMPPGQYRNTFILFP